MWIEYKDGIYNTKNWNTVELAQHDEGSTFLLSILGENRAVGDWMVVVNKDEIIYETKSEDFARQFYNRIKSTLGVSRVKFDDPS